MELQRKLYRHYKGQHYIAYFRAKHTETDEDVVVYRNVRDDVFAKNGYHVRPTKMFFENLSSKCKRFEFIEDIKDSHKGQSKKHSLIETSSGMAVGFAIAWAAWYWAIPLIFDNMKQSASDATGVTLFFTALSLVRAYYWRRLSNWVMHRDS